MLSNKDLYAELETIDSVIETENDPIKIAKASLKCLSLVAKLCHNIRANQVSIMMKEGVELVKSPKKEGTDDTSIPAKEKSGKGK